ncbi:hypothetical protein CYMTET_26804 [Cymbomonas tetramitiformis]|uniref:Ribose-phosphate pyrophosphokinase N-terminal domain-containing protein n=1 Tax=Cymbomonas tetramitiformis TaxID=36881 RepID=A0AAE0FRC3_9CHLO|nr:hypothetical protein CYMTET_26804 [Cymbomonas tetramitiformis]
MEALRGITLARLPLGTLNVEGSRRAKATRCGCSQLPSSPTLSYTYRYPRRSELDLNARSLRVSSCKTFVPKSESRRNSLRAHSAVESADVSEVERPSVDVVAAPDYAAVSPLKERILFHSCDGEELAQRIAASNPHITLGAVDWRKFEDGFPNLFVEDATDLQNKHVAFLATFNSPGVIFEQLSIIYALPRMFVASFTLVLPFFPTGTAERMEDEGDVATAAILARILSNIPLSQSGPTKLVIYDIHALQERFYFGDSVLPFFQTGIPLLKRRLLDLEDAHNITIAYPDEGAWKRFHNMFIGYPERGDDHISRRSWEKVLAAESEDSSRGTVGRKSLQRGRETLLMETLLRRGWEILLGAWTGDSFHGKIEVSPHSAVRRVSLLREQDILHVAR